MKEKIYLIPGLMTDERLWIRLKPYLENEYELIHLAIPSSENFDEIIEILDKQIPDEKINLLGFSLGGYIASYFSAKKKHKMNRLFLVASTPSSTNIEDETKRRKKLEIMKKNPFEPLGYEKAKSLLEEKNQNDEELIKIIENMYLDLGLDTFITQMNSTFNRIDLLEDLENLNIPINFFVSKDDRLLNKESLNRLINQKSGFSVIVREGTSHNIPLEEPEHLSKLIKNWMNF